MNPITFQLQQFIPRTADEICMEIADVARWSEFKGYGPLPGIESAMYEVRADTMIGSRIRVRNTDGSGHVEEITKWVPGKSVAMKFIDFSPPLSRLASHFNEEWTLNPTIEGTIAMRRFELYPIRPATRPFLWLISLMLRRAIRHHFEMIAK
jgi:hypothetical protein